MSKEEINIDFNNCGELPHNGYILFSVNTRNQSEKLNRIKDVIKVVSRFNETSWPTDIEWEELLPFWFVERIKKYTLDEIKSQSNKLWDFGSWLDAMKYRGWKWFSSGVSENGFTIILQTETFPFSINPLEYVIMESEVPLSDIVFIDFSKDI